MRLNGRGQLAATIILLLISSAAVAAIIIPAESLPPKATYGRTRNITLVAQPIDAPGPFNLGFNGTIPGPTIIIDEGDEVFLTLVNKLSEPVSIHVHGVHYEIKSDGTFHTASFAPPGGTYTYHWVAGPGTAGTWHYHDHVVGNRDVGSAERGLFGALIVRPPGETLPKLETVVFLVNNGLFGSIIRDGKERALGSRPTFEVNFAERIRFHLVSEGTRFHTFRMAGHSWFDSATGRIVDSKLMGAAETYPFDVVAGWSLGPGDWTYSSDVVDPNNNPQETIKGILQVKPSTPFEGIGSLGFAKIMAVELSRTEVKPSEVFMVKATVEYSLQAPTTVRFGIFDRGAGRPIASQNRTLLGKGAAGFEFQLTAPSMEILWRLRAEVAYLIGGAWRSDRERPYEELQIKVGSPEMPQEAVPTKPTRVEGAPQLPPLLLVAAVVGGSALFVVVLLFLRKKPRATLLALFLLLASNGYSLLEGPMQDRLSAHGSSSPEAQRSFTLVAQETQLRPLNWAFNSSVPGPTLIANAGDRVSLTVVNRLRVDLRFQILRGLAYDGMQLEVNSTQLIAAGNSMTIAWNVSPGMNGTWYYRDQANADRGLFGAIIVRGLEAPADREFVIFMVGFELHGNMLHRGRELALGVNPTLEAKLGERVRFHVITEGKLLHTFHIHAHRWVDPGTTRIIDTKTVRIAQIHVFDVMAGDGVGPGDWMYHCHVVEHMQFGMIGIFRVS